MQTKFEIAHHLDQRLAGHDHAFAKYLSAKLSIAQLRKLCFRSNISYDQAMTKQELCILLKKQIMEVRNDVALLNTVQTVTSVGSGALAIYGTGEMMHANRDEDNDLRPPPQMIMLRAWGELLDLLGCDNSLHSLHSDISVPGKNQFLKKSYTMSAVAALAALYSRSRKNTSKKKQLQLTNLIVKQLQKQQKQHEQTRD